MSGGSLIMPSHGSVNRLQERLDLKELHDQLVHYIQHVQDLKYKANSVDSSAFIESIKVMEDSVISLRSSYEKELNKARLEMEDLNKAKNEYALEMHKARDRAAALENRLANESQKTKTMEEELNVTHRALSTKDAALQEANFAIKGPTSDLHSLRREYEELLRENQDLRKKYDTEQLHRQEVQEKIHLMQEKLLFTEDRCRQEMQDLQERLNAANSTILTLESKVRQLASPNTNPIEMIARVREAAEAQLRMYREESEMSFSKGLTALKIQIDNDARKIEELTNQNVRQTGEMGELMASMRKLEGQISSLEHQKASLQEIMMRERAQAQEHIQFLEQKLKDLQDILVDKMREVNVARDAQLPLKAEIEALRTLLEEEQKRLSHLPQIGIVPRPAYGQSGPIMPRLPRAGFPTAPTTPLLPAAPAPSATAAVGPVRTRSAPVRAYNKKSGTLNLISPNLGHGKDYFDQMFSDLTSNVLKIHNEDNEDQETGESPSTTQRTTTENAPQSREAFSEQYYPPVGLDPHTVNNAIGDVRILEVHPAGNYIRLLNTSRSKDAELGGFILQQNVSGNTQAVFRFPARVNFAANSVITIWSGSNDPMMHQPPTDFRFSEHQKWETGSGCTTILCKPNGQAVAWTSSVPRPSEGNDNESSQNASQKGQSSSESSSGENMNNNHGRSSMEVFAVEDYADSEMNKEEVLPEYQPPVNGQKPDVFYIYREKEKVPSLLAQKHPHGSNPGTPTHPATGQPRAKTYGNDNSSVNRQSRVQSTKPDPVPGAPYAGASAQRMGSGLLRKYSPSKSHSSGAIANKAMQGLQPFMVWYHTRDTPGTVTSAPPSAFQSPHTRFQTGLEQIRSQHHEDFLPPMPRPPLFSTW